MHLEERRYAVKIANMTYFIYFYSILNHVNYVVVHYDVTTVYVSFRFILHHIILFYKQNYLYVIVLQFFFILHHVTLSHFFSDGKDMPEKTERLE